MGRRADRREAGKRADGLAFGEAVALGFSEALGAVIDKAVGPMLRQAEASPIPTPTVTQSTGVGTQNDLATQLAQWQRSRAAMGTALGAAGGYGMGALPRSFATFTSGLAGPGMPITSRAIDTLERDGNAMPRLWQYPVTWNLDLHEPNRNWERLLSMAEKNPVVHRCINIRTADMTSMSLDFTLSDQAISGIMDDQNVGRAEAARIGQKLFKGQIDDLRRFWTAPYPSQDLGWTDWIVELLWNHFVFDGVPIYPRFTYGKQCIGFEHIDPRTIKVLLDMRGKAPDPPNPAYQQILWGFPRGDFMASPEGEIDANLFSGSGVDGQWLTWQLSYFKRERRVWAPYGFSSVEASYEMAALYMERLAWLAAEYREGTLPTSFILTDSTEMDFERLAAQEAVFNEMLTGNTAMRHRNKFLPEGFKPDYPPSIDNKYLAAYDEHLIKMQGMHFGVAPTALGIIPTRGLGGGGQQASDQDQDELGSSVPLENWLIDLVNALSRRYLGSTREVTATFTGGETVEDEMKRAQVWQTRIYSATATVNDALAAMGEPPSDDPAADLLILAAPGMPVSLNSLLGTTMEAKAEAAAKAPPPPPPGGTDGVQVGVDMGDGKPQEGAQEEEGKAPQGEARDGAGSKGAGQAPIDGRDEKRAFRRYVAKRRRTGEWSDFTFRHLDADEAKRLNADARAEVAPAVPFVSKAAGTPSATEVGDAYGAKFLDALTRSVTVGQRQHVAQKAAVEGAKLMAKASRPQVGDTALKVSRKDVTDLVARIVDETITPNGAALTETLKHAYADGYMAAIPAALDELGESAAAPSDVGGFTIDWNAWEPGQAQAALQVSDGGLADLLDNAGIAIAGINATTLNRIGTALADGITNGATWQDMSASLNTLVDDQTRADMIAITETNRAYVQADLDSYAQNGVDEFDWEGADDACEEICQPAIDDNPHDLSDDAPPGHPDCRCFVAAVIPEGGITSTSDDTSEE